MTRDVQASAYPHVVMGLDVVQKSLQSGDATGSAQEPAMHANAHHFGAVQTLWVTFFVQRVKGVFHVLKEWVCVRIALRQGKAHVVAIQGECSYKPSSSCKASSLEALLSCSN